MKKTYYVKEYSPKQWIALINQAIAFGCSISYNIYGDRCEIDSTEVETRVLTTTAQIGAVNEEHRQAWADHIHNMIQDASNIVRYKVICRRRRSSKSLTEDEQKELSNEKLIFKNRKDAEIKAEYLRYKTGNQNWRVYEINPDLMA